MLFHQLNVSGMLSFGPSGVELPLSPLNVLIGPNGSGKSNLLDILSVLSAAPSHVIRPIRDRGGISAWLWQGEDAPGIGRIEAQIADSERDSAVRHRLEIVDVGGRPELSDETIEPLTGSGGTEAPLSYYRSRRGRPLLSDVDGVARELSSATVPHDQSVLSAVRDPERYPLLDALARQYEGIRMYRNWPFGPGASIRRDVSTHEPSTVLCESASNLTLVLHHLNRRVGSKLKASLRELYEGMEDLEFEIAAGNLSLFLRESGDRLMPASRLSDGALRYLALLAILLSPVPPPVTAIEEPELGLHPDVIPHIAELLLEASVRTQLVITTHSRMLIDALGSAPQGVVVCSKAQGETRFDRLNSGDLKRWLEHYSLGELWSMGQLGGNRWCGAGVGTQATC